MQNKVKSKQQKDRDAEGAILGAISFKGTPGFMVETEGDGWALSYENGYTTLRASFYQVSGDSSVIRIRTTFWRAENEVNKVIPIEVARAFYLRLLNLGFQKN